MAFPVPAHLPRKGNPHDISTRILTKVSEATNKSLNASVASQWLGELEETIHETKSRIHERIHADLPAFERQFESSKAVQERLHGLNDNVEALSRALHDENTGLVPKLLRALKDHSALAQRTAEAQVAREALAHLDRSRTAFRELSACATEGRLVEAVKGCKQLNELVKSSPTALAKAQVMKDLERQFRAVKSRTEELLDEAYSRSIVATHSELTIRPSVQVSRSSHTISLPSLVSNLPAPSLASHLASLRRVLVAHYIECILSQPTSLTVTSSPDSHTLTLFPAPPDTEDLPWRLTNLGTVFTFLSTHLFPALPSTFPPSLSKPLTNALLNRLLIPSLPSALDALPPFLALARQTAEFEAGALGGACDGEVGRWVDGVGAHYERKRRVDILERARALILKPGDEGTFRAEVVVRAAGGNGVVVVQDTDDDAWNLDDPPEAHVKTEDAGEDGWGFDDEPTEEPQAVNGHGKTKKTEEDDPWGWTDDAPPEEPPATEAASSDGSATLTNGDSEENNAWDDDPWADTPADEPAPAPASTPAPAPLASPAPKRATRLEKLAMKGKGGSNAPSPVSSPMPTFDSPPPPSPAPVPHRPRQLAVPPPKKPPVKVRESYLVSVRAREMAALVRDVRAEGRRLAESHIFAVPTPQTQSGGGSGSGGVGCVVLGAAPAVLDLYRALWPVARGEEMRRHAGLAMRFANDCAWIAGEVAEGADECGARMEALAMGWYEATIERVEDAVLEILGATERFEGLAEQDRFDECEGAVSRVLREIRGAAQQWKPVLTKSKYFDAVGTLVETALARILEDVLALEDIPEVESGRLSELCKILNALEGLFVDNPEEGSLVVVHVPSWLKYSYLPILLEAPIAYITQLFEQGALVDFEVDELVKLVRALFADTPLRAGTITRLQHGHPVPH